MATTRRLDVTDSARALALMNLAMADAFIAGFKIRYVYDSWRPVTAIREGDNDGNDATVGDPTWDSHQNTPAVSDYPSTQSAFSGAAAVVLAGVLGSDEADFTFTSGEPFEGISRSFKSFSQASRESADSRVYAGIHSAARARTGSAWVGASDGGRARSTCSPSRSDRGPAGPHPQQSVAPPTRTVSAAAGKDESLDIREPAEPHLRAGVPDGRRLPALLPTTGRPTARTSS